MLSLDAAATTALDPRVLEAMLPHLRETWGNPSSPHAKGREARASIDTARRTVSDLLAVPSSAVLFVSSGSEANALALLGTCQAYERRHGAPGHLVVSAVEHRSILKCANVLQQRRWAVDTLSVDQRGAVDPTTLENFLRNTTALVAVQWINNEVGTIQPITQIEERCRARDIPLLCDAVQGVGILPLPSPLPALVTMAAHKFHGPKGIAALINPGALPLEALIPGEQEFGLRGGTENVAAIVGFAKALELAMSEQEQHLHHIRHLRRIFTQAISSLPNVTINSPTDGSPHIVNVRCVGCSGETLVMRMDLAGICISTGSACATGAVEPSPVLRAMGCDMQHARESIRVSFDHCTTEEEIVAAVKTLEGILEEIRSKS